MTAWSVSPGAHGDQEVAAILNELSGKAIHYHAMRCPPPEEQEQVEPTVMQTKLMTAWRFWRRMQWRDRMVHVHYGKIADRARKLALRSLHSRAASKKHINATLAIFFKGAPLARRVGFSFADHRLDHIRSAWDAWRVPILTSFRAKLPKLFTTELSAESTKLLNIFAELFAEANNMRSSAQKGNGSLGLIEVAAMIRKLQPDQALGLSVDAYAEKIRPVVTSWDINGNGTLEFHELCTMLLTDNAFCFVMHESARTELLCLFSTETPHLINGKLRRHSMVDGNREDEDRMILTRYALRLHMQPQRRKAEHRGAVSEKENVAANWSLSHEEKAVRRAKLRKTLEDAAVS